MILNIIANVGLGGSCIHCPVEKWLSNSG